MLGRPSFLDQRLRSTRPPAAFVGVRHMHLVPPLELLITHGALERLITYFLASRRNDQEPVFGC